MKCPGCRQIHAPHVVKRSHHQGSVRLSEAEGQYMADILPVQIAVSKHDPFGVGRRAGGIHQSMEVIKVNISMGGVGVPVVLYERVIVCPAFGSIGPKQEVMFETWQPFPNGGDDR